MPSIKVLAKALGMTLYQQTLGNISVLVGPSLKTYVRSRLDIAKPESPLIMSKVLTDKAVDGAIMGGLIPANAYAKYALPKGLPTQGKRTLAIENEPHTIDNFDGRIDKGYGKGVKTLISKENVIVKLRGSTYLGKMNYHFHEADKAGPHYDIVVEGIPAGTRQFEINIPRGIAKGRYAFVTTSKGMIVTPMKDYGELANKPNYNLKHPEFLEKLGTDWIIEQKIDGSLGNAYINDGSRAYFRSHRDSAETYFDKLPALEFLNNTSPLFVWRQVAPNPGITRTMFQGELVHPDGVSRVSGILNALPALSRRTQEIRGPVKYYVWDILRYNGRDVSKRPYSERRELYKQVVDDIKLINPNWDYVASKPDNIDPSDWYEQVIKLPLPYGEGIVMKEASAPRGSTILKVKQFDLIDMEILPDGFTEGEFGVTGKYVNKLGGLICRDLATGNIAVVGTGFTDYEREWIWEHKDQLVGAVVKTRVFERTNNSFRAPRFVEFHESKGNNEHGLLMYSESLAGMDIKQAESTRYALKSAAGWRS